MSHAPAPSFADALQRTVKGGGNLSGSIGRPLAAAAPVLPLRGAMARRSLATAFGVRTKLLMAEAPFCFVLTQRRRDAECAESF